MSTPASTKQAQPNIIPSVVGAAGNAAQGVLGRAPELVTAARTGVIAGLLVLLLVMVVRR